MARDRKRAKQRQRRRSNERQPARVADRAQAEPRAPEAGGPADDQAAPSPLDERHEDPQAAPPPLEESSAEVELAEAAMADPPSGDLDPDELPADEDGVISDDEDDDREPVGVAAARGASTPERTGAELPEGNRFVNFLRACVAELRRVQWPDRRQVAQATGVVLGFVIIAGAYLGVLDAIFSRLVNLIL
jgi:preprotein translocase SecE subunit